MGGQTDGMTDKRKSPCVLQDFVPFGAAAQKGKEKERRKQTEQKEETKRKKRRKTERQKKKEVIQGSHMMTENQILSSFAP